MEESAEEALRRDETIRIYNSAKEALRIIGDIQRDTISVPVQPVIQSNEK